MSKCLQKKKKKMSLKYQNCLVLVTFIKQVRFAIKSWKSIENNTRFHARLSIVDIEKY